MRVDDAPVPAVVLDEFAPDAPLARWPWRPTIALEYLPQAAYVWDDADPAVVWDATTTPGSDAVLDADVGTVSSTPATVITGDTVFTFDCVYTPTPGVAQYLTTLWSATVAQRSWMVYVETTGVLSIALQIGGAGDFRGVATGAQLAALGAGRIQFGVTIRPSTGRLAAIKRNADGTWSEFGTPVTRAAFATTGASTQPVRVGQRIDTPAAVWKGELWAAERRDGLDPTAGTVVWRFDAADRTGTGTSYTDPRGRTWTLTSAAAITPGVPAVYTYQWDAPFTASGFSDVACDFAGLTVEPAAPDELGLFGPTLATLTLVDPDGRYSTMTADGRLVLWAPGRRMCVWLTDPDDEAWWLWAGRITDWRLNADGTVTVEAYDGLAELAEDVGVDWQPGAGGQFPLERIVAIAGQVAYDDPIRGDPGDVALTTELADQSPLEAMQRAALSDGGIVAADADGAVVYRDRLWRAGRTDQATVPVFSDNVCTALVVWDLELAAVDEGLVTSVLLTNLAGLTAGAALPADDPTSWYAGRRYQLTHPDPDLWPTQDDGDELAAYLLAQQSTPTIAPRPFTVHMFDPHQPGLWPAVADLRRGDRLRFLHDYRAADGPATLDVYSVVVGVAHDITPESWVATVTGTRTVDWTTVEQWDLTRFTWDDPDELNVWRY